MEAQRNRSRRDVQHARSCERVGHSHSGASNRDGGSSTTERFPLIDQDQLVIAAVATDVPEFQRPDAVRLAAAARCGALPAACVKSVQPATAALKKSEARP